MIDNDGTIFEKRYIFGLEDEAQLELLAICDADSISRIIDDYAEYLESVPRYVNVGCYDGLSYQVKIWDQQVYAINLRSYDLQAEMEANRLYYDQYKAMMLSSNILVDLSKAIAAYIEAYAPTFAADLRCPQGIFWKLKAVEAMGIASTAFFVGWTDGFDEKDLREVSG